MFDTAIKNVQRQNLEEIERERQEYIQELADQKRKWYVRES